MKGSGASGGLRFAAFGMELAGIMVGSVIAGYYADRWLGSTPILTLLLAAGGMYGAVRRLLWSLEKRN